MVYIFLSWFLVLHNATAFGQSPIAPQGLINKLITIKYSTEQYVSVPIKENNPQKDSALAHYNTLRWMVDGFVYQLSGDLVAANSPKKIELLNQWCWQQTNHQKKPPKTKKMIQQYVQQLKQIESYYQQHILKSPENTKANGYEIKTLNLTTNVFYLIKDSYSVVKGLSDLKTQKAKALIEILDHTRLLSPTELIKSIK